MQPSHLDKFLQDNNIVAVYIYNDKIFYDTKDFFDRHNFARDVKRSLLEEDWVLEKTKYYLTAKGIVELGMKKSHVKLIEGIMGILQSPYTAPSAVDATPAPVPAPEAQSFPLQPTYSNDHFYNPYMMPSYGYMQQPQYYPQCFPSPSSFFPRQESTFLPPHESPSTPPAPRQAVIQM